MTIDLPEILTRPLRETVAGLANEATREALYRALRARREDVEPVVNAFEARREQSPRAAKGPLNGLPVTVKDQIAAGGWPRTFGLERPSRRADRASATIVARLVGLGAEVTGKTALPPNALDFQTFNRRRGRTNNPHDPRFTAGGSSGGGAAAVASGMSLLDIGADLAGSLRLPAAWCGVSSLTPTEDAWPADGMLPGGQRLQHFARIGPIARRVDDLAFLWDCLARAETGKETSGSYRIGLWTPDSPPPMEAAARTVWNGFSTRLAATGVTVEPDPMRPLFEPESYRLFGEIMGYETGALIPAPIRWLLRRDRSPARRS
ncbi:MAG: amidase family protein, partial [Nitratireductor sp.]